MVATRVPWRRVSVWAAVGTAAMAVLVLLPFVLGNEPVVDLIRAAQHGPSVRVVQRDFPGARLPSGVGLDGQQYYAMAREPLHPIAVSQQLDRPRYRLQRPLFPILAWALDAGAAAQG